MKGSVCNGSEEFRIFQSSQFVTLKVLLETGRVHR